MRRNDISGSSNICTLISIFTNSIKFQAFIIFSICYNKYCITDQIDFFLKFLNKIILKYRKIYFYILI